jgi:4a-hydroxytetrahydrobiopterin dehydratase
MWKTTPTHLEATLIFDTFLDAIEYMHSISHDIDTLGHHPDWKNIYNKIYIQLSTHDAGTVTEKDHILANMITKTYIKWIDRDEDHQNSPSTYSG